MTDTIDSSERRKFTRFSFEGECQLEFDNTSYRADLLDISLKGVLISIPDSFDRGIGDTSDAKISLNNNNLEVSMRVEVAHVGEAGIGLKCLHIDIDSISHLRRLVELNLGTEEALQRELVNLIESYQPL